MEEKSIINSIQQLKTDPSHSNRYHLLLSLSNTIDEKLVDVYRNMLLNEDEKDYIKFKIISNLSKYPDSVVLNLLSITFHKNYDKEIREEIIRTLGNIKPELSIDFFVDILKTSNDISDKSDDDSVNLDEDLKTMILDIISLNLNHRITDILIDNLKESINPDFKISILKIFAENGNSQLSGKVLDNINIKEEAAGVLIQLFHLLRKNDPFITDEERATYLSGLYINIKDSKDDIKLYPHIREIKEYVETIGGETDVRELKIKEQLSNPYITLLDGEEYFLLNGRKIFAKGAPLEALRTLVKHQGSPVDNIKYIEFIDPNFERTHGDKALTDAVSKLKKAIEKFSPEFNFKTLIGKKYGKGYYLNKNVEIIRK